MSIRISEEDLSLEGIRALHKEVLMSVIRAEHTDPQSHHISGARAKLRQAALAIFGLDDASDPQRAALMLGEALQLATGDYTLFLDVLALQKTNLRMLEARSVL